MCIHGIYDGRHLIAVNTRRSPNNANITPTFDQCCLLQCPLCQGWILRNHFTFIHPENYISVHITVAWHPCKHDKFTRWWFNVGTASYTVALHLTGIRLTFRVYWERPILYNTILIVFETCAVIRLCHNDVRHLLSSPRYVTLFKWHTSDYHSDDKQRNLIFHRAMCILFIYCTQVRFLPRLSCH